MTRGAGAEFERLVEVMRTLRSPQGCPWDREQTLESLRRFVLEETYEVLDAIDRADADALEEEVGDLLFEAVFLAQVASEAGHFDILDSIDFSITKLVRRHPHVFREGGRDSDSDPPPTAAQVVERWEELKARERSSTAKPSTSLSGVPKAMPSLLRAYEIGSRAAAAGFDWPRAADVLAKIEEEVAELRRAIETEPTAPTRAEEEMGDLLFAISNLSRKLGIDPESALRRANDKFTARFDALETSFLARDRRLQDVPLEEKEDEWQRIKRSGRT